MASNARYASVLLLLALVWQVKDKVGNNHPLFNAEPEEIVSHYGYPFERHTIVTQDGYILELHRIPHGKNSSSVGKPILIHHALVCSSFDWVINPPEQSLTYALADGGYDIWLANARGNLYSQKHENYSVYSEQFWDFSWSEMGEFDLPAEIDYILNTTGHEKLHFIGHSMGTTVFFVLMAQHPQYNDKVASFFALGPAAKLDNIETPIKHLTFMLGPFAWLMSAMGQYWVLSNNNLGDVAGQCLCREEDVTRVLCENVLHIITGFTSQINKTMLPVYLSGTPAGTSMKTLVHYMQITQTSKFLKFDYQNTEMNKKVYGQQSPPEYDVSRIKIPVYAYFAKNDWMATPFDVAETMKKLPNVQVMQEVDEEDFSHIDFMWGKNNRKLIYNDIINSIKQMDQNVIL